MDTAEFNTLPPLSIAPTDTLASDPHWCPLSATDELNINPTCHTTPVPAPMSLRNAARLELWAKRGIDVLGASLGLILLAPLMLVIAQLIRRDSPGPILFRQRRHGRNDEPFWILKFRTMRADAEQRLADLEDRNEAAQGVLFKMTDDPRVTRLGRFLRKTNLDELPQLWNVLRGEMSLVGPRPLQFRDSERLKAADPAAYQQRLLFPPGITGAWQVGRRSPTDSECLIDLDLKYIQNWSLLEDLRLIYRTFFVLLAGFGGSRKPEAQASAAAQAPTPVTAQGV